MVVTAGVTLGTCTDESDSESSRFEHDANTTKTIVRMIPEHSLMQNISAVLHRWLECEFPMCGVMLVELAQFQIETAQDLPDLHQTGGAEVLDSHQLGLGASGEISHRLDTQKLECLAGSHGEVQVVDGLVENLVGCLVSYLVVDLFPHPAVGLRLCPSLRPLDVSIWLISTREVSPKFL